MVRTVHDAKLNVSNQPYIYGNVNTIDTQPTTSCSTSGVS